MKTIQNRIGLSGQQSWCVGTTGILVLALWLAMVSPRAEVIAWWRFEPGALEADASGNGNTLVVAGLAGTADKAADAPGAGAASFDGVSFARTAADLDLSGLEALTLEWFMRTGQPDLGVIVELSENFNNHRGSFISYLNEGFVGQWVWGTQMDGYAIQRGSFPQDGGWHHYAVTVDTRVAGSRRLQMYVDGVRLVEVDGGAGEGAGWGRFPLFIGARGGSGLFFVGELDEVRLSRGVLTPDQFLRPVSYPDAQITLTQQPQDGEVLEYQSVTLAVTVEVVNAPEAALIYQWQRQPPGGGDWVDLLGAWDPSYQPAALRLADSGVKYRVLVRLPGGPTVTSREATLTVRTAGGITDGLVGHYRLDGDTQDSSPRANHATPVGGPVFAAGRIGQALVLNGADQLAQAGDPGLAGAGPKSVSVWFYQTEKINRGVLSFGRGLGNAGALFELLLHSGVSAGHFWGGPFDTIAGGPPYEAGRWHHAVLTYDGTTVRSYLDGQLGNEKALALNTAEGPLLLGSGMTDEDFNAYAYFNGLIDDVGLWNRVLSATEIRAIYAAGLAGQDLTQAQVAPLRVEVRRDADGWLLEWSAGTLQSTDNLNGPWSDVTGATSPYRLTLTAPQQFYRLRQ